MYRMYVLDSTDNTPTILSPVSITRVVSIGESMQSTSSRYQIDVQYRVSLTCFRAGLSLRVFCTQVIGVKILFAYSVLYHEIRRWASQWPHRVSWKYVNMTPIHRCSL